MQSLMNEKTTEGLACSFTCAWEYEKHNALGTSVDTVKALFLFQCLVELEKSDAPFKDSILSSIDLLQNRIRRIYLSEDSWTLDIDLGVTNAQCTCFECLNHFIWSIRHLKERTTTLHSFFLYMTRIQLLIHHFDKSFVVKQTLASIQSLFHEMFRSKDICDNFVKVTFWFPKTTTSKMLFL